MSKNEAFLFFSIWLWAYSAEIQILLTHQLVVIGLWFLRWLQRYASILSATVNCALVHSAVALLLRFTKVPWLHYGQSFLLIFSCGTLFTHGGWVLLVLWVMALLKSVPTLTRWVCRPWSRATTSLAQNPRYIPDMELLAATSVVLRREYHSCKSSPLAPPHLSHKTQSPRVHTSAALPANVLSAITLPHPTKLR